VCDIQLRDTARAENEQFFYRKDEKFMRARLGWTRKKLYCTWCRHCARRRSNVRATAMMLKNLLPRFHDEGVARWYVSDGRRTLVVTGGQSMTDEQVGHYSPIL